MTGAHQQQRRWWWHASAVFITIIVQCINISASNAFEQPTCSARDTSLRDANLHRHTFDIGYGEEEFDFYVTPDVSTFYQEEKGSRTPATPKFNGISGKFINLSNEKVEWFWDPGNGQKGILMAVAPPFESVGTATFPSHKFYFSSDGVVVKRFVVVPGRSIYYYDPFEVLGDEQATRKNLEQLNYEDYEKYEKHKRTMLFNEKYREITGRDYLPMYPRNKPIHYLWPADYYGQQHWATTNETHFTELPPEHKLKKITAKGEQRILSEDEPRMLHEYRSGEGTMNMTLTVLSCAPRVFEINNFLSDVEVDHVMQLANAMDLRKSTTSGGGDGGSDDDSTKTRTSFNTWVDRDKSPIVDSIYRRSADLLLLDEALLRRRGETELQDFGTRKGIAESLQLVHYSHKQEYTAHHDYGFGDVDDEYQEERYATLLLYLNEGMSGGETCFPRWLNSETSEGLCVKPKKGKAVLFFSFLPDGNMDDLSQHAAEPVTDGEKWLMNLCTFFDFDIVAGIVLCKKCILCCDKSSLFILVPCSTSFTILFFTVHHNIGT